MTPLAFAALLYALGALGMASCLLDVPVPSRAALVGIAAVASLLWPIAAVVVVVEATVRVARGGKL